MKRQRVLAITIEAFVFGGVLMVGAGSGVTPAGAAPPDSHFAGLPQNWDQKLTTGRFTVLSDFGGLAVRDNETGLVWE